MNATKILNSEIEYLKVASLPTRPTAPEAYGGAGYTASDMKRAFDKLPLFIVERFNALLDDISAERESSILASLKTGFGTEHTVSDMLRDVETGTFADYLSLGTESLATFKEHTETSILTLKQDFAELIGILNENGLPCDELYQRYCSVASE